MANFTITLDLKDFETRLAVLKKPQAPLVRALNRSAGSGQTLAARLIAQDTGLKVGDVKKFVQVKEATSARLEASVHVSASRVPLMAFGATGPEPSRGRPPGVKARLKGGPGIYPHAFIAKVRGPLPTGVMSPGHRGVFQRRPGVGRLPIVQLRGPSLWQAFQKHQAAAAARTQEQLGKNVQHEIEYALTR